MIADLVSYEMIAITMFATMLLMLLTGQRVFGAIGFVAAMAALLLWGDGAVEMPYTASWKLFKWYPMLTLPLFIYMGYMISESGIADDLCKLWLAGIFPGIMMATLFILYIYIRCKLQPELGPALPKEERQITRSEKFKLLQAGLIPFAIFFSMTGLFLMGIASLVECSAVGAFGATLAALLKGKLTWNVIESTLKKTLGVSCMFMWIILAALSFGAVFDGIGAVRAIETLFIERWNLSPWGVLIMMQLSYILMGMFLDDTAMLVIVAPLYVPLIIALGFDPIWYGVLYTITCQIAYMTPPFGYNLFLMRAMAPKEINLMDIYRSIIPFVLVMCLGLAIVMIFPEIATWLPDYVSRK